MIRLVNENQEEHLKQFRSKHCHLSGASKNWSATKTTMKMRRNEYVKDVRSTNFSWYIKEKDRKLQIMNLMSRDDTITSVIGASK